MAAMPKGPQPENSLPADVESPKTKYPIYRAALRTAGLRQSAGSDIPPGFPILSHAVILVPPEIIC